MLTLEFKIKANEQQYKSIDEAIRIGQFIRNKCLRLWMDSNKEDKINGFALSAYTKVLSDNKEEFPFVCKLNSQARQASAERAWSSINRFYSNCKKGVKGKKGHPQFKKNSRSIEYKSNGWKLSETRKHLTITDKTGIGKLKLLGTWDLNFYQKEQIKRVRIVKKADGYYAQFCIKVERNEDTSITNKALGIDVGLESFYTDSNGVKIDNPRFLRKSELKLKRLQRSLSKKKKGSNNRKKAQTKLGKLHLKVSRQRKDFVTKLARCVMKSNDFVMIENLNVKNMVRSRFGKSINDAGWSAFKSWLEYYSNLFNRVLVKVDPKYTSQDCSNCNARVKKSLSTRTHFCKCGFILDRDYNAAINILNKGIEFILSNPSSFSKDVIGRIKSINACGQINLCVISESLLNKLSG